VDRVLLDQVIQLVSDNLGFGRFCFFSQVSTANTFFWGMLICRSSTHKKIVKFLKGA
jgi:hypothetical protein